jgi:hypothetical protein
MPCSQICRHHFLLSTAMLSGLPLCRLILTKEKSNGSGQRTQIIIATHFSLLASSSAVAMWRS